MTSVPDGGPDRPSLHRPVDAADLDAAVRELVQHLQGGADAGDADVYDGMFAADVLWGSPYGAVLAGYDQLNAIHHRLMAASAAPRSRFEPVQAVAPAPGVVVAHIRRQALSADGTHDPAGFSEMAMYVLVRRDGRWWLAGGQNTPLTRRPAP
jgi:uncharacterized protein (TIGR02246 family)